MTLQCLLSLSIKRPSSAVFCPFFLYRLLNIGPPQLGPSKSPQLGGISRQQISGIGYPYHGGARLVPTPHPPPPSLETHKEHYVVFYIGDRQVSQTPDQLARATGRKQTAYKSQSRLQVKSL